MLGLALGETDGEDDGDMLGLALGEMECGAALTFTLSASTAMACLKKLSPPSSREARKTPAVRRRPVHAPRPRAAGRSRSQRRR